MSLLQFLLALRARFAVFAVALIAVVAAAIAASILLPHSYRATVSVLVGSQEQQSMDEATLRTSFNLPQEQLSYLQTQADILGSPKVARRVVQDLKLAQNPQALVSLDVDTDKPRIEDQLVEKLLKKLKVETSQSSVILGTFTADDPYLAANIANGFAAAYIDTMLELRVAPTRKAAAWFDQQLQGLRANLEEAQKKLRAAQDADLRRRAQHPERMRQVRDDFYVQQLRADLLHGEEKLRELSTQYGVNHPTYRAQVSQNDELRDRLQTELARVAAGVASSDDPGAAARSTSGADGAQTAFHDPVLEHNVESAERAYDTAWQRYLSSQVESRASQGGVAILSPAVVPFKAHSPNIPLNLALAIVIGLALGSGLVALLEKRDARVRCAEDLRVAVRLPLLAVLSDRRRRVELLPAPEVPRIRALPRPG